jgi:hypothetical protein
VTSHPEFAAASCPFVFIREQESMENEKDIEPGRIVPANDNSGASDQPDAGTWQRVDRTVLTLARIIGRRMAREDFERLYSANDNRPIVSEGTEDEADRD